MASASEYRRYAVGVGFLIGADTYFIFAQSRFRVKKVLPCAQFLHALAVRRLVDVIQGNTGGEVVRISVQPEIVQRKSVAPPPED